jgi:hypothetical protein
MEPVCLLQLRRSRFLTNRTTFPPNVLARADKVIKDAPR